MAAATAPGPDDGIDPKVLKSALVLIVGLLAVISSNSWLLALWLVIRGFGLGAVTIPVMAVAFLGLDKEQIAHSGVITRTVQQLGGSFGTAVLAVILSAAVAAHQGDLATGFDVAFWWATGFSALAVLLSLWLPGSPRTAQAPSAPVQAQEPADGPANRDGGEAGLPRSVREAG